MRGQGGVPEGLEVKRLLALPDPVAGRRKVEPGAAQAQQYLHYPKASIGWRLGANRVFTPCTKEPTIETRIGK
jgi:hypothetical protein